MNNNLMIPQSQSMGLAAPVWTSAVAPQQPQTLGNTGIGRQGLADLFFTAAANAGGSNGTIDFGIGKGMAAYANRLEHDRQQKAAYEQQLGKDKKAFLDQLRSKYTPESIVDFNNSGMTDYSLLVELPRQFATQKQTGAMVDGKFVAGEGDTYNVKYDQFGNVLGVAETAPEAATTKEFVDSETGDTYLWSIDPVTGDKIKNLGLTARYVAPAMSATEFKAKQAQKATEGVNPIQKSIDLVDKLMGHKGIDSITGTVDQYVGTKDSEGNPTVLGQMIPSTTDNTETYDALAILDQLDAQNFMAGIQQMKGMGALSNAEGAKVQASMAALRTARGDTKAFNRALERLKADLAELNRVYLLESQGKGVAPSAISAPTTDTTATPQKSVRRWNNGFNDQ